jgi:hypothetical protein
MGVARRKKERENRARRSEELIAVCVQRDDSF